MRKSYWILSLFDFSISLYVITNCLMLCMQWSIGSNTGRRNILNSNIKGFRGKMDDVENIIREMSNFFVRVNKSYLVNRKFIKSYRMSLWPMEIRFLCPETM